MSSTNVRISTAKVAVLVTTAQQAPMPSLMIWNMEKTAKKRKKPLALAWGGDGGGRSSRRCGPTRYERSKRTAWNAQYR